MQTPTLVFRGVEYRHRWSRHGQNEFTPQGQEDLTRWRDMLTLDVYESVADGDRLAQLANKILENYQGTGKVLRTDTRPSTAGGKPEHLIVAVLFGAGFLEAAFARLRLSDGVGTVIVYSHRVYGESGGQAMGDWLKANGPQVEFDLMALTALPAPAVLESLPQSL